MRKADVKLNRIYVVKVSGNLVRVRLDSESPYGGWNGTNLATGRKVRIKTAARLRYEVIPRKAVASRKAADNGKTVAASKPSLAATLESSMGVKAPHLVVNALAGTGKTFTQIVGVAYAFGRWEQHRLELCEREGIDPASFAPSPQQKAVWDAMKQKGVRTIIYSAFNKSIVNEFTTDWSWMQERLQTQGIVLQFATINSLGYKVVTSAFGRVRCTSWHTDNLLEAARGRLERGDTREMLIRSAVKKLVGLCKLTLAGWTEERGFLASAITPEVLDELAAYYDIDMNGNREEVHRLVPLMLQASLDVKRTKEVDFDDQNWLPVVLNLSIPRVDIVLVDEAQDLPRCKQEFCRRLGRRLIVVGDKHQAIYGFAGADTEGIDRLTGLLGETPEGVTTLELTETRRCGKAIVAEAQRLVPGFRAHESNPEGCVRTSNMKTWLQEAKDGDMALCRVNAPLISEALKLLKAGRKAVLRGRDFGGTLKTFISRLKASDVPDLIDKVGKWHAREVEKENRKRNPSEARIIALDEKADCIYVLSEGCDTVDAIIERIDLLFQGKVCPNCGKHYAETVERCPSKACKTEADAQGYPIGPCLVTPQGVLFSSVHRAKGLEAKNVFLLLPPGAGMPHPMAKSDWQREQERHLRYVAITRAIDNLTYVYK